MTDVFASGVKEVAQGKKSRVLDLKYFFISLSVLRAQFL